MIIRHARFDAKKFMMFKQKNVCAYLVVTDDTLIGFFQMNILKFLVGPDV